MGNLGCCGVSRADPTPGDTLEEPWPSLRGAGRTQLSAMPTLGRQGLRDVGDWVLSAVPGAAPALDPSRRGSSPAASEPCFPAAAPHPPHTGDPDWRAEGLKTRFKILPLGIPGYCWLGWGAPGW